MRLARLVAAGLVSGVVAGFVAALVRPRTRPHVVADLTDLDGSVPPGAVDRPPTPRRGGDLHEDPPPQPASTPSAAAHPGATQSPAVPAAPAQPGDQASEANR